MLVPLSWLREYVDFDLTPEALAERLTVLGLEVEGIARIGSQWSSVVVGELLEVAPHPHTRRLSLTRVSVGDGPELSIVCGATNIAAGQRVPVAVPGAQLPGGRHIEITQIAGIDSQGMLCSGAELGLTSDADGILILGNGARLGTPLANLMGDDILDVDVKPNRGDALSIVGLAREVAATLGTRVRQPVIEVSESGDATEEHVRVHVRDVVRCPRFVARYVDGVTVAPSPLEVQVRLTAAGIRPISNVVDASNYVMVELGKPIHTFDAAGVAEGGIIVRLAEPGERLETLDHVTRELDPETLLIADATGPLGIAGVIGGAKSEVSDGTSAVIVESAIFDPVSIRRTARRYGLRSEAGLRFEKGQESRLARVGADRAAQLIVRWAGGRAAVGAVDTDPIDPPPVRVTFRPARISRLLGTPIEGQEMSRLLERVEVGTQPGEGGGGSGETLVAIVPSHRRDLVIEADICEEVVRVRGYETVPPRLPDTPMPGYRRDPRRFLNMTRDLLANRGLSEVVPYNLISAEDHARLGIGPRDPDTIVAANPVSTDHAELGRSLIPELVRILVGNERQRRDDVRIFTIDTTHAYADGQPRERLELGILMAGSALPPAPLGVDRPVDLADLKGTLAWLVDRLTAGRELELRFESASARAGVEHPGRTAFVAAQADAGDRRELGRVWELDPRYLAVAGARAAHVVMATLDMAALETLHATAVRVGPLERVPGVERDIAIIVPESTAQADVADVIRTAGGPALRSLVLFDVYTGAPLDAEQQSLAYRLRFEPGERPLAEADLEGAVTHIVDALRERLGARLRG